MRIDVVTLFPAHVRPMLEGSIIGRACAKGLVTIEVHDLWRFVPDGERADDAPYGGGPGMVMRLGPIVDCLEHVLGGSLRVPSGHKVVVPSPAGEVFGHARAAHYASLDRLIIVCGHYEGIDERLFSLVEADEVSIGDFVLTGGEIPALAVVDACVRLMPGTLSPGSAEADSFSQGILDWPHYTRPATFRDVAVPEILLSGDHQRIARWRRTVAEERTRGRRPDLSTASDVSNNS